MVGVDQLLMHRRGVGKDAQPAERIHPLEFLKYPSRNGLSRYAMEAIAACDVIARQALRAALMLEGQVRALALELVQLHLAGVVQGDGAAGLACLHQVASDFGLAVDHHALASGQPLEVDALAAAIEGQLETIVRQAFAIHARGHAGLAQQVDHTLFEHAGADAAEHVVGTLAFEDDVVDAGVVQQLAEQQAGRASADDGDLSVHYCSPVSDRLYVDSQAQVCIFCGYMLG